MTKSIFRAGAVAGALVLGMGVGMGTGATALAGNVLEACAATLEKHCADVTPGSGRLYACLYAHEDKVSGECDQATGDMLDGMDLFFEKVRFVKQECQADIQQKCAGVEIGGGRILSCLKSNESTLAEGCVGVLKTISLPAEK